MADEGVTIRLDGEPGDALRAIEEVRAALAGLHDQTVRVRVEQEKLNRAQSDSNRVSSDAARVERVRANEVDKAERSITHTIERESRRRNSLLSGVGRDLRGAGGNVRSILPETGPRGIGAVGAGIAGGVALLGPLRNLLGLVGAVPAAFGAAGIAATAFAAVNMSAVTKAAKAQEDAQKKLAAGTITAAAAQKAMKNAVIDLTSAQKQALPWARSMAEIHDRTAESIQKKLLPAIGALGRGLQANQRIIQNTLTTGAGKIGAGLTGIGGFLGTGAGKAGVSALGRSSNELLGAFSMAAIGGFRAFLSIAQAAQPLVHLLSQDILVLSARFAAWTSSLKGQQALKSWFTSAEGAARGFLHVLFNLGAAINNIAVGTQGSGQGLLSWLDQITNRFANFTGSAGGQRAIGDAVAAVGSAFRQVGSDIAYAWGVAKPFLDTLRSIGQAVKSIVPGGATTIGTALAVNFATGGIGGKLIGRGIGAAAGAGVGALGAGGVGAAAGGAAGGGALAMALPVAGVVALGAALVLLAAHYNSAYRQATAFAQGVTQANAAAARASSVLSGGQIHAKAESSAILSRSQAQLSSISAAQTVRFDKTQLKGATGQQKVYWTIMLQLDRHSLQEALDATKKANQAVNAAAETHREDVRGTKDATAATNAHIAALNGLFETQSKVLVGAARGVGITKIATTSTQQFVGAMQAQAAAFAAADPKAAHYAASAARLAQNIGHIPTKHQVDVYVRGLDTAVYSIDRFKGMLASIPLSVQTVLTTINPGGAHGGRPPGYTPPRSGPHGASGMYLMGQYRGVDTINARLAPGEVVLNPGQIDAIGRGRIMGTLARTGGKFVNATGYASGGLVGANEILGTASAYLTSPGGTARAASAAASHYTRIPQLISRDTKDRHRLVKAVAGEQHLLDSLRKSLHGLTGAKNAGKRKGIQDRISGIVSLMRHHKHDISAKTRQINALEGELGIVPGEDRFQRLVDDLEGQQVAATTFGNTALAGRLQKAEVTDYQRRVRFLSNFTQLKGVRKIPDLWQAANQALVARSGELSSLTGATTGGGGGAGGGGPDQHTQDVMDSLRDFVAQAIQMQAVTAGQTSLAMDFLRSQVGSFAAGTDYVPRTGYAMVHQGEAVIPAWQNGPRADSMTGNFTINGSDALTQAIARAITPSVQIEMGRMTRRLTRERRR